ncbi:WXG100 family type VII secretion target [Streptomyces hoynatensis]|uniref:ESAT-6-like protein n=1 Tax=Streptomyces hoynatensis TaxID=1141874 RepID=A0A3A9YRX4_9ACTN|nr:WXG100 family type VII secretion target [Streptomyces hoynatensis]RKN38720.1 WXG100 family type VII secretion target [Streptomyces hoynatensis]
MSDISVNYAALTAGADGLTQQEQALLHKIEDLAQALNRVAAGWTGEAQRAFHENMRAFAEETANLAAVLGRTGNQLGNAQADYRHVDHRQAAQYRA